MARPTGKSEYFLPSCLLYMADSLFVQSTTFTVLCDADSSALKAVPVCRYVTRDRVQNMLDYEYLQCFLTLKTARGKDTAFFAFADTVVAKAFGRDNECHGWLGIKYQSRPG